MRIVLDYRPALTRRTGVGEYAHRLSQALLALLGPEDELALFSSSWKERLPSGCMPGAATVDVRFPNALLNLLWHRAGWPSVERFTGPADIAQSMHPLLMPARSARQFVVVYDLYFLDHPGDTAAEIRRDYGPLAGRHARQAAGVVVISDYTAAAVRDRLGVAPERLILCPPGAPDWAARSVLDLTGPLLFIGNPDPRKNLPRLLRAYARLLALVPGAPDLVMAGQPPAPGSPLAALLASPTLGTRVRHIGYVADEARPALFRQASMLLLPSLDEGFGMPALEAMATGVPVVCSNRGALPEVTGGAALLVDPEDEPGLAEAMAWVLRDRSQAASMAEAGLARARTYTWQRSAERLLAAYRAVLAAPPRAGGPS